MRLTSALLNIKVGDLTKAFANLPDRYIKRASEQVYYRTPRGLPQYLPRDIKRKKYLYTVDRPWTQPFWEANAPGRLRRKVFVEPILDWMFFRGDRVEILVGRDKGKQGIVEQVIQERNWVIVQGLNTEIKRMGKEKDFPGICILEEKPLLVTTEVALVDPADLQATKVEWRYTESGEKVRVSERTGRIIPMPKLAEETKDYKTPGTYKEQPKDTVEDELTKITFEPKLHTFEMDIMEEMEIKEDRVPVKSYWY